ncbi:uncharacterized protein F5891DRAFT_985764 [Suillus fuscotomentosus]|uniref:Uncharacterized protein n=1 Tax=Suillus fuscotomentosus TaxID=1912939 RepID=A0AAD4DVT5_9AGAM|nr:uncharacterized protein F5891DRAFT_985764 [Suillus fuscotomentosus]KAG1893538.1 hypothetical protein F5891DRAFT_985764 [Suillus fuscotomentosus]
MSQPRSDARRETRRPRSSVTINSVSSVHQCTRAQTAAYLLGIRPELPDITDTAEQYQAPELDKIEFRVPLHTMDRSQSTTYVGKLHSKSDGRRDIFDSIRAIMDVPELYEHLGWRLSTARRTNPPHRLLTVHNIDSAFKAARADSSGRRHKKVAIEILNTEPTPKDKPAKQRTDIPAITKQSLLPSNIFVISKGALGRQQEGQAVPQPLKRTYALYLDNDDESSDDEPLQEIEDVVTSVHSRYPAMNFRQYIGTMKDRGILYLSTAAHFNSGFYKEKIGMSEGAAYTFHSYVENTYIKAERRKQGRNGKGKKAQASS